MIRALALISALFALLLLPSSSVFILDPVIPGDFKIRATPVLLNEKNAGQNQIGRLHYLGGWHLESKEPHFGSLSGLIIEGQKFVSITDYGGFVRFDLTKGHIEPLPRGCGNRAFKTQQDAESISRSANGRLFIGLEGIQVVCAISADQKSGIPFTSPEMQAWRSNGGPEAIIAMPNGGMLVFEENRSKGEKPRELLYFAPSGKGLAKTPVKMGYLPPARFSPTDATMLPDGRMLILNRAFTMLPFQFTASLVLTAPLNIKSGAIVQGTEIARLEPPLLADNFEGVTARQTAQGTEIFILSDDNFFSIQRTLLLKFLLAS